MSTIETATEAAAGPLVLGELQAEVVALEATHLATRAQDPGLRYTYDALARAADTGAIDGEHLVGPLAELLELGLVSGRIRAVHGPAAEQAARRLYGETPAGRAWRARTREATRALGSLEGRTLDSVAIASSAPGSFALEIETAGARIAVELDGRGVTVRSLELAGSGA